MTSFVAATSPNGELHVRKFDNEVEARIYEVSLWCYGWDTRPVLTVHDEPGGPAACIVCDGAGCEHCPKVDAS